MADAVAFEAQSEEDLRKAGAYQFVVAAPDGPPVGINHACPCGCGELGFLRFAPGWAPGQDVWTIEGTWPKVTLSPSIGFGQRKDGAYHWHGYLTDGVFKEC